MVLSYSVRLYNVVFKEEWKHIHQEVISPLSCQWYIVDSLSSMSMVDTQLFTFYSVLYNIVTCDDVRVDITLTWKHWYACIISLCFYTTIRSILLDGDPIVTVNHHPNDHWFNDENEVAEHTHTHTHTCIY